MEKYFFQFVFLFLCLLINKKRKGSWLIPSNFILGLYSLCAFLGMPAITIWDLKQALGSEYWIPLVVFSFCTFLYIYPFMSFNEERIKTIILPPRRILDLFSDVIILLSLYSIIYYVPTVSNIFQLENLAAARTDVELGEVFQKPGLLNTIATVSASLNIFAIVLFFIYSAIGNCKKRLVLLLISSFSEPIQVLTFVGRDGVVFWIFASLFCYLLFRPYLTEETNARYKKYFIVAVIIILIPFLLISVSRFGESEYGLLGGVVSYLGQGFICGPLLFGIDNLKIKNGLIFPLFFELTGITPPPDPGRMQVGDWCSWYFSTSIGSFYLNVGAIGLAIILIVHIFYFQIRVANKRVSYFPFYAMIVYLLYFRLVAEGVFYFREYTRGGNLFIVLLLFASFFFRNLNYHNGVRLSRLR